MNENNNNLKSPEAESKASEQVVEDLGIAGRITSQFINSPVTPLLMLAFLAIGVLGLIFTPRQEDPKISVPMVDIYVQYSGASAAQVTSLVTEPLERIMSEIPGVRHVYSATQRGSSVVTVQFKVGQELEKSIVKVHDKVQSNLDKIPPGVSMPLVKPVGIDDVPIVSVTLWSKDIADDMLRTLSFDVLQRLQEVPNTGNGFVVGGRADQVRVEVYPERLSGYGMSLAQLAKTIQTANSEMAAGNIEGNNVAFNVYTGAFLRTADEISRLVIGVRDGSPVYVRDVARVFQSPEETKQLVNYYSGPANSEGVEKSSGDPAVTIAIAKKIGTNGVSVSKAILKKLESLKGKLIPANVNVEITRDYGKSANNKVNELLTALLEAAVAVSVLCLIGLGLRAATVVITVIPIVVLITIWAAWVIDYTIDRVSLFALVFSIGILVDDATVVVENIFRRWLEAGKTTVSIAIDAVREVGNPTVLATLTIIAALLPMGVVSGMMGPYMRPIPVLGASAMFFSLIAAFVFAPWMAMRVRPKLKALQKAEKREEKMREAIGRYYRPCMLPMCNNRSYGKIFLVGLILATLLACAMFYTTSVTVKMLPFDNKPEFNVVINMPEGTALPVTANVTAQIAERLRTLPEVTDIQTYVGTASPFNFNGMVRHYYLRQRPWQADIQVMLLDKDLRERASHDIAVDARHIVNQLIQENVQLQSTGVVTQVVEMPPGPPVLQTVVAEIYGPDAETRRQVARDMTGMFKTAEGVVDVDNYLATDYNYWRFEVDIEKAVRFGISVDTINQHLAMSMGGFRLGDIKRGVVREPTYIVLQVPLSVRSQVQRLKNLPVMSNTGKTIPLGELGRFIQVKEDPVIFHKDLRGVEYVTGEMEGRLGAPIYGMFNVEDMLEHYTTPDNVTMTGMPMGLIAPPEEDIRSGFEWGGEWTVTYETFRDMGLAFMAALLLIYGLIVWEFKNFTLGGLIMAPIPLTLIGIIPGHWIMGAEFTATSMIGFIALAGIVVRNSILLVEFVKNEVACGKDITEAVVDAGQTRMRPILITALTLMAGSWMIITDPIFQGMAVSLLFGAAVSTVLTLVVIPLGCISTKKHFYDVSNSDDDDGSELVLDNGNDDPSGGPGKNKINVMMESAGNVLLGWMSVVLLFIETKFEQFVDRMLRIKLPGKSKQEKEQASVSSEKEKSQQEVNAEQVNDNQEGVGSVVEPENKAEKKSGHDENRNSVAVKKRVTAKKAVKKVATKKVTKKKIVKKAKKEDKTESSVKEPASTAGKAKDEAGEKSKRKTPATKTTNKKATAKKVTVKKATGKAVKKEEARKTVARKKRRGIRLKNPSDKGNEV